MTLLEEILASTVEWPDWQSDALRRLFTKGILKDQDLADLRAMVEKAEGSPSPIRIDASHIPNLGSGHTTKLLELRDLQHVNRFAAGRSIRFSPTGLNVVFGENGTGKSGYSRVVKRACRARHAAPVLPDAFDESPGTPSASIVVLDESGDTVHYDWKEGMSADDQLAMVSVYDSQCSDDYVAKEGPCDYQPYGLPYLSDLIHAQIYTQVAISNERKAIHLDAAIFSVLNGDHSVGRTIAQLGVNTDLDALRALAKLSGENARRIEEIENIQAALDVETPARSAEALAKRLDHAVIGCKAIEVVISDCAIDHLHELTAAVQTAIEADTVAQSLLRGDEGDALAGSGSQAWKSLFLAAQRFSAEAYPKADGHPATDEASRCVLCQQELTPSARERLQRFRTYVASEAATSLAAAHYNLVSASDKLANASTDILDETTAAELRERDPTTSELIEPARQAWTSRQQWAAHAVASGNWCCPRTAPPTQPLLSSVLTQTAQAMRDKAAELRASKDEEHIRALAKERAALVARRDLATLLAQVEQYVLSATKIEQMEAHEDRLQTKALSTRVTRLSQKYVTEALATTMREELASLGSRSALPVLKVRTDYGANLMTLSLESTRRSPGDVLSEGEQRAMGLALFLAEARMRGDMSTIVFDDPSTSLDHRFREKIARRIVTLAQERQVIVFTHDVVFMTQLQMAAADADLAPTFQTVEWESGRPGVVRDGLAWANKSFFSQLDEVYKVTLDFSRAANQYLNDEECRKIRDLYAHLRGAIERGVREIILFDVVHPFVDEIKVPRLGAIVGFGLDEWEAIVALHDRCSAIIAGHDTNADRQQEIPHPNELLEQLKAIRLVFQGCDNRSKEFNKKVLQPHMSKRSDPRKS